MSRGKRGGKAAGRHPDYTLRVFRPDTMTGGRVGAAWVGAEGRINIYLDTAVSLTERSGEKLILFPYGDPVGSNDKSPERVDDDAARASEDPPGADRGGDDRHPV